MVSAKVRRKAQEKIAAQKKKLGPNWQPSESLAARAGGTHLTTVSKARAERLGISDEERKRMTPEEFAKAKRGEEPKTEPSAREERVAVQQERVAELNKGIAAQREETTLPTISLGRKEQALEERPSARQQALEEHPKLTRALETSAIVLGAVAVGLGAYAVLAPAGVVVGGVGTKVGSILHTVSIHHWSKSTGLLVAKKGITLSRVPILEKASKIGATGVSKLFKAGANVAINKKTTALALSETSKHFSMKALAFYGTWASSVFLGKWAQAEAAEPITIPLRDALRQAQETGDFTTYDEYLEAAREIANPSIWRTIISFSPLSAIPGIQNKMKGVQKGIELIDKIAEKAKQTQAEEEAAEPEPTFAEEREAADVEARGRELEERKEDTEFFEKQRGESRQEELRERQRDALYFELIRQKRYEEAAELLQEELKR